MRLSLVALFLWLMALAAPASWAQAPAAAPPGSPTRITELTVRIVDEGGNGVPDITVNVAHGGWVGTTRAVDYSRTTGRDGVARFSVQLGRYAGEQTFGTTLKIEAIDQIENKTNRLRATYDSYTIRYGLPALTRTLVMLPGSASSDNVTGIPVRVKVVDGEGKAVPGATVSVQSQNMDRKRETQSNAEGFALLEATVYADVSVTVEASKPNHKSARKSFRLNPRMRSQGVVHQETLELAQLSEALAEAAIRVRVADSKTNVGIPSFRWIASLKSGPPPPATTT